MKERYSRNLPALSAEECHILQTKKILIAGCGGLGGNLIEHAARIGIGHIRAVDFDVFEASNLNRQLLSETALLGKPKALAAADRVKRINPNVHCEAIQARIDTSNIESLIDSCDLIIDGMDNIETRRILCEAAEKAGIPYVYGAAGGWVAQASLSLPGDHITDRLYREDTTLQSKTVLGFAPALCASIQISIAVKHLVGRSVEHGVLYFFDLLHNDFETIPLL